MGEEEQARNVAEAELQRGPEIDAERLGRALAAGGPEPKSVVPVLEERYRSATNRVNARSRQLADARTTLNYAVNAEARGDWLSAEMAEAEQAEADALASAADVKAEVALAKRSRAAWVARAASGEVRDCTGPQAGRLDLVAKVRLALGIDARQLAARLRPSKREAAERRNADEAAAAAAQQRWEQAVAEQLASEERAKARNIEALRRFGGKH